MSPLKRVTRFDASPELKRFSFVLSFFFAWIVFYRLKKNGVSGSWSAGARSAGSLSLSPSLMVPKCPSGAPDLEATCTRWIPLIVLSLSVGLLPGADIEGRLLEGDLP